ncbi:MAG: hypothetical protein D6701_07035, partial [Gemmatimonadetes bacterium]
PVPYEVTAGWIRLVGDRLLQARTRVEIERETLQAFGDSTAFDQQRGELWLFHGARVLDQADDTLDVRGDSIRMRAPGDVLETLDAFGRARLRSAELDLQAPRVTLLFRDDEVVRLIAVRPVGEAGGAPTDGAAADSADVPPQPVGRAEAFELRGDSIDADAPGGSLERVVAVGRAVGESTARDSLNTPTTPEIVRRDWVRGDTVIVTFLPPDSAGGTKPADAAPTPAGAAPGDAGADTAGEGRSQARIESLWAKGNARSLYRTQPRDTVGLAPGMLDVNHVEGDEIRLFMKDGEVERMEVENAVGIYLQPVRRRVVPPDSARARPDTTARPDTARRPRGGPGGGR